MARYKKITDLTKLMKEHLENFTQDKGAFSRTEVGHLLDFQEHKNLLPEEVNLKDFKEFMQTFAEMSLMKGNVGVAKHFIEELKPHFERVKVKGLTEATSEEIKSFLEEQLSNKQFSGEKDGADKFRNDCRDYAIVLLEEKVQNQSAGKGVKQTQVSQVWSASHNRVL